MIYKDLKVWQKSMVLVNQVYEITQGFPESEKFGLISQMRRAAVSIPSNIAEGYGRGSKLEYSRFVKISRGSLFELDTQMEIAKIQDFIDSSIHSDITKIVNEVGKMINGLIKSLERS